MIEAKCLDSTTTRPVHPPAVITDNGTVLATGRRFRSAVDKFTALDKQHSELPTDSANEPVVRGWVLRADAERHRLFDRVFYRRAETLGDAAV